MFPAIAQYSDDLPRVKQLSQRCLQLLSYVLVPCMFGMAAVMEPLLLLLLTEKWAASIPIGQVLSIDVCIALIASILLQIIKAIGRSDVVLKLEFWKKPVYMLCLLVGIRFRVLGLAVAMLVYDVYAICVDMLQIKKYVHYAFWEQVKDMLGAFALGGVMAVLVWLIPAFDSLVLTLAVKVLAGVAVYAAGSVLLKMPAFDYLKGLILERFLHKN